MTSQVNPNNIDGTYPVAGQDNDSQGFRDNFTNIRNNLTFVKAEIEDIQNKAIFKTALNNTTLDNEFAGNIISNPSLTAWRETYNNIGSASGSVTVNFANGNFQKITMAGSMTLSFSFPANTNNQLASIKLWIVNPSASYTLTLPSAVTLGDPDTIAGLSGTSPPIITFSAAEIANNTNYLFEFFTVDGGTTIGIKDLIRNRDVDLSGFTISGNLTTAENVSVGGNLIINGGIINSDYLLANVETGQNLFANVNYNRFIANASPTGTVANLFITLPDSVENGRLIDITSMTAITSCFVSNMTPGVTSVYGLANNWSASASLTNSVSIKLLYNASVGRWFKVG
jgi:hypothetical protein